MPTTLSYRQRRGAIETYFDATAVDAWARLTSDEPVGRIRATVRAGRDDMRNTLLSWLPQDMRGLRILDAGCGTGALAVEAARRGADVVAVDIAPNLIKLAKERAPRDLGAGSIRFLAGDMLDPALGDFDHVVSMDALIHYGRDDAVQVLSALAQRTRASILITFAPRTTALAAMHRIGRFFPRADRAPSIIPVEPDALTAAIADDGAMTGWRPGRTLRISRGFYVSQAMEMVRS
jgi:magnesium-protoporphyrin O-methyltransferase